MTVSTILAAGVGSLMTEEFETVLMLALVVLEVRMVFGAAGRTPSGCRCPIGADASDDASACASVFCSSQM